MSFLQGKEILVIRIMISLKCITV